MEEFSTKYRECMKRVLGDKLNTMICLGSLATAPEKQHRGYATTLVQLVNSKVCDTHSSLLNLSCSD